jgi:CxxC motif-containing protein (DUF1111 family)
MVQSRIFSKEIFCQLALSFLIIFPVCAQSDPGLRTGAAGAGGSWPALSEPDTELFVNARARFRKSVSVSGSFEPSPGLGPAFNGNSCAMCHAHPAVGGSSPPHNPQLVDNFPHWYGALNPVDLSGIISFLGPVRQVRFVQKADGSPDGGVYDLFTIAGRMDAHGCNAKQPDFQLQLKRGNIAFRIPTPLFGAGLLETISDDALIANLATDIDAKRELGISGRFNRSQADGAILRFGWKAQQRSLLQFAGEAYIVEQGVSSELFPAKRAMSPRCDFNPTPEDTTEKAARKLPVADSSIPKSDIVAFAQFSRLSAPPLPTTSTASEMLGKRLFDAPKNGGVGCALCHTSDLRSGKSSYPGMSNVEIHPYSDLALHHMGSGLADRISEGVATGDEFRTAPLWGIGQRVFFLHDGRTNDLLKATLAHKGPGPDCRETHQPFCASEANAVVAAFAELTKVEQQALLDFLRSL